MIALGEAECCAPAGTHNRSTPLRRWASRPQLKRDPLGCDNYHVDTIIRAGLLLEAVLAATAAAYEGRAWAHRQPSVAWPMMFRPDALFRSRFFTEEGNRLRRIAILSLMAFVLLGGLLLLLVWVRDGRLVAAA